MATTTAPLISFRGKGQVGKAVVYGKRRDGANVRVYVKPKNPKSADQVTQRSIWSTLNSLWHSGDWSSADKLAFSLYAKMRSPGRSGWNTFVKQQSWYLINEIEPQYYNGITFTKNSQALIINGSVHIAGTIVVNILDKSGVFIGSHIITQESPGALTATIAEFYTLFPDAYYLQFSQIVESRNCFSGYYPVPTT